MIVQDQKLDPGDKILEKDGCLVVTHPLTFHLCRCRECKDACRSLSSKDYILCVQCNNNCTQKADPKNYFSEWLGPFTGPRRKIDV